MTLALVVDDDDRIRVLVRRSLEGERIDVVEATDVAEAVAVMRSRPVDVALLDVGLPSGSGYELLPAIRELDPSVHVIMVTGAGAEADRVRGLRAGADDYVVKPFSLPELAARVAAGVRRRASQWERPVELGSLRIDPAAREVTLRGEPVALTPREHDLLHRLASAPGRAFSREELLRSVWGSSPEWQSSATVNEHVRRLRVKLEDDPRHPRLVVTVTGVGYRLDPPGDEPTPSRAG